MILNFILGCVIFSLGFFFGTYFKAHAWYSEDWTFLRWDYKALGYRPMNNGSIIQNGDNVMMSLKLNTAEISNEGIIIDIDEDNNL